ncbi:TldD/PmbA family protein [bacterium]|nr:TldD/PmbA family protein [candidate division CSSED10-310 bacterium]
MRESMRRAIDVACSAGAEYADVRFFSQRAQYIMTSDMRVRTITDSDVTGFGVRVLVDGCWGFSGSGRVEPAEMERVADRAVAIARAGCRLRNDGGVRLAPLAPSQGVWCTAIEQDPFEVSMQDKVELLLAVSEELFRNPEIRKSFGIMQFIRTERRIISSEGTDIEATQYISNVGYQASAVGNGDVRSRMFFWPAMSRGYELVTEAPLLQEAGRIAAEAVELLHAPESPSGEFDLILDPAHLSLVIHESVGHATELDRVLGMEESLAGRSFATPDKVNQFAYGSSLVNLTADTTFPGGLATMGWDDDGVPGTCWPIVKDGILAGYATNREVAPLVDQDFSRGCNRADHWGSVPIVRIPNLSLEAGKTPLSLDELIADTKLGIYMEGRGSWSIDQMRLNFQFGADAAWLIKDGTRRHMLKNVIYQSITPEFWGSCDAVCDQRSWRPFGITNCGKGDPGQLSMMTHGAAPARFRKVKVGGIKP